MKKLATIIAIASLAVASCAPQYGPDGSSYNNGVGGTGFNKQQVGTVLGGIGGGILGNQVGKGQGKTVATIGGAILGGLLGSSVGQSLDRADMQYANSLNQNALEQTATGVTSKWVNPDSGNSGTITPVRTFQTGSGNYCREFNQTIVVGGQSQKAFGTACRQPDGSWKITG